MAMYLNVFLHKILDSNHTQETVCKVKATQERWWLFHLYRDVTTVLRFFSNRHSSPRCSSVFHNINSQACSTRDWCLIRWRIIVQNIKTKKKKTKQSQFHVVLGIFLGVMFCSLSKTSDFLETTPLDRIIKIFIQRDGDTRTKKEKHDLEKV